MMDREQKRKLIKTQIDPEHLEVISTLTGIRPTVLKFAVAMERKLVENDHKGGWKDCTNVYLFRRLKTETKELKEQIKIYKKESQKPGEYTGLTSMMEIKKEAADVANFAMMIADNNSVL